MSKPIKLIIDPTNIQDLNSENMQAMGALKSFLEAENSIAAWAIDEDYEYTYQKIKYQFCFVYSILKRKIKDHRTGDRFEIYNPVEPPLGKGGYGAMALS